MHGKEGVYHFWQRLTVIITIQEFLGQGGPVFGLKIFGDIIYLRL